MVNIMSVYLKNQGLKKIINPRRLLGFRIFKVHQFSVNMAKFSLPVVKSGTLFKV